MWADAVTEILNPAPPWESERSEYVILWHGCTAGDKDGIEASGIDLAHCRPDRDFGRGFYTTTIRRQAAYWAWKRRVVLEEQGTVAPLAVVLRFRVPRVTLANLSSLHFVRGDFDNEDYWSLVQHCRQSVPAAGTGKAVIHNHHGPKRGWYDMVTGPVAAFWEQRIAMAGSDQVSFHTPKAIRVFNELIVSGNQEVYRWEHITSDSSGGPDHDEP